MHRSSRPAGPISTTFDGARETTSCAIRSMPRRKPYQPSRIGQSAGQTNKSRGFGADAGVVDSPPVRVPAAVAGDFSTLRMCVMRFLAGIAPSLMLRVFLPSGTWPKCLLPEVKFSHVQMQMPLRAMLIDALHAPLEDTEVSFNGCLCGSGRKRTHQRCDAGELTA